MTQICAPCLSAMANNNSALGYALQHPPQYFALPEHTQVQSKHQQSSDHLNHCDRIGGNEYILSILAKDCCAKRCIQEKFTKAEVRTDLTFLLSAPSFRLSV
jgi:hypothetical protein